MNPSSQELHMIVTGRVQGVGYRAATQHKAQSLELDGWVRNRPDGSVEILAQGDQKLLVQLESWCHHGPSLALVDKVTSQWRPVSTNLTGFQIRY